METRFDNQTSFVLRLAILAAFFVVIPWVSVVAQARPTQTTRVQAKLERFWLAGRYDGDRVIVYFDAVKFNDTAPSIAERLTDPVVGGFYMPVKLPRTYIANLQQGPDAEHFKLGDHYDLLLDCGKIATVTLTTMIGTEGDEGVGNDSYIGALATLDDHDDEMFFTKDIYVVRRHRDLQGDESKLPKIQPVYPGLEHGPVRFDIQTQIVDLLTQRMQTLATDAERHAAEGISPIAEIQAFRLADGSLRYYARAAWTSENEADVKTAYAFAALLSPSPKLHIIEVQNRTSRYDDGIDVLPSLLNVIDLGEGRTGIVVSSSGQDSAATRLLEYRDGVDLWHMRFLQSLESGE